MVSSWWLDASLFKERHKSEPEANDATEGGGGGSQPKKVILQPEPSTRYVQCLSKVLPAKTPHVGRIHSNTHRSVPSMTTTIGPNIQYKCCRGVFQTCLLLYSLHKMQRHVSRYRKVLCLTWNPLVSAASSQVPCSASVASRPSSPFSLSHLFNETSISLTGLIFQHWTAFVIT